MTQSRGHFLHTHKRTIAALLFGLSFSVVVAYATPPGSAYTPGETLDPSCAPGDTNCSVTIESIIGSTSTLGTETWLGTSAAGLGTAASGFTVFLGVDAGKNATSAGGAVFIGNTAGSGATGALWSNFIGVGAGGAATGATYANFIGSLAGQNATGATYSNFIGYSAGLSATSATYSNFIGKNAGLNASNAAESNFIGDYAGNGATNATLAVFIGSGAGNNASNASNSIFIGQQAGYNDTTVDNTGNADDFSILIGKSTSTGGFSNSIALGGSATNTAPNQFMIGSSTRTIEEMVITGSGGQSCSIRPDTAGINCSSDERLKTNITDLQSALDDLGGVRVVNYNWSNKPNTNPQVGFIAQNLEEHFPTLVSTASNGYLQVNYAGITPILVKAIQELNIKVNTLAGLDSAQGSLFESLRAWFANIANGITKLFAGEIETKNLCISDDTGTTCITKSQLDTLIQQQAPTDIPPQEDINSSASLINSHVNQ